MTDTQSSDHFDGKKFFNAGVRHHDFGDFLRWRWQRRPGRWRKWVDAPPGSPPQKRVGAGELRVTFVNHATVLLQLDGINLLTDPIWSTRCSPFQWIGPKRHRPPGIRFEDLPPIDYVLLSHNHYDHMDLPTLRRIAQRFAPRIIVPMGNAEHVRALSFRLVVEQDWWQEMEIGPGVRCQSLPAQHFSGRLPWTRDQALWAGYCLKSAAGNVVFLGDTGWGGHIAEVGRRCAPVRLAMLPIGAYLPRWFMSPVHFSPQEALEAHRVLGAQYSVAVHFGTFALGDDGEIQAVEELNAVKRGTPGEEKFWVLGFGEGRPVPALP